MKYSYTFLLFMSPVWVRGKEVSMCVYSKIDPLRFLGGCHRRRLNQGLVATLNFSAVSDRAHFCIMFWFLDVRFDSFVTFPLSVQCN